MDEPEPPPAREWPIPPMDHEAGDKATAFTWAMGNLILKRISEGETMKAITADARMPAYCTVFRWMQVVPPFGDQVRGLRAMMAASRLEERDAWAVVRGPKRRSGRRSTYRPETGARICDEIKKGASLSDIVARPGAPSFKAIYRWLRDQLEFRAAFVAACEWRAGWLAFQADMVIEGATPDTFAQAQAEHAWLMGRIGRLTPRTYRAAPRGW